ncbi:Rhomboid family protein [Oscillochloris trichoides DG-6]|uniref:Rhomboid family protein n=1 Tax=Oscillochloris trichoides DG-6 TaxID=765420 RepID=E1IHH8_9CHLR|nr:rhomboid family intramembrane serine protease [Oscillochloris trichoides]EFO79341.1 Rhomboid family protein [Oscillochloris trichoides DG-6]
MTEPNPTPPRLPPTPAATSLLWAIGIIYLLTAALSGGLQPRLSVLVFLGAKVNELIAAGAYWRLLSATFLHGSLIHILFNGYALYALGPETERIYGTRRFLALYFLAGLGGSLASYLLSPSVSVGASGAIFGLIGGLGIFYYLNRAVLGNFGKAQVQNMATVALINLFIGFSAPSIIDNWGHLGGLVGGIVAGWALAPRFMVDPGFYPPLMRRTYPAQGWMWAVALVLVMLVMVGMLPHA